MSKKQKLFELLKNVDLFGVKVDLLIKREETHKTYFGSFLTLGMFALLSVLAFT